MKNLGCTLLAFLFVTLNSAQSLAAGSISMSSNNTLDLGWGLGEQVRDVYQVRFLNFSSESPKVIAIDSGELSFADADDAVRIFSERYSSCVDIQLDRATKVVSISPRKLIRVKSQHATESTYEVEGKETFSLITETESRDRYFCVYRPDLVTEEWQKRALLE